MAATAYKTPGVYVEEISRLPPSVSEVSTAIPAFIGYTQKRPGEDTTNTPIIRRIGTLLEYEQLFGAAEPEHFAVATDPNRTTVTEFRRVSAEGGEAPPIPKFLMYYALRHFFQNGGGSCYIVSVGPYAAQADVKHFEAVFESLKKEDEPTLIVLIDAINLSELEYYSICAKSLEHCQKQQDRFAIVDVKSDTSNDPVAVANVFRSGVGTANLAYGAAYYPYLKTLQTYLYDESSTVKIHPPWRLGLADEAVRVTYGGTHTKPAVRVTATPSNPDAAGFSLETGQTGELLLTIARAGQTASNVATAWQAWARGAKELLAFSLDGKGGTIGDLAEVVLDFRQGTFAKELAAGNNNALTVRHSGKKADGTALKPTTEAPSVTVALDAQATAPTFDVTEAKLTIRIPKSDKGYKVADLIVAWEKTVANRRACLDFSVSSIEGTKQLAEMELQPLASTDTLASLKSTNSILYNQIKALLAEQRVTLPPSAAVAGIYARVDRERGVWKAPANVSVQGVIGPVTKISDEDQKDLNEPTDGSGKSINAIRAFAGKGTLVWGARTLDGASREWRYIPVRRLFIMVEESARKASAFAVFEPNDLTTWLKVKGMIESFLYGLWERGALAGPTPASAYYVNVGLGKTMTQMDILDGKMIVEIGLAAVRPAEFIVLRFSHKLQEA